MLTVHDLSGHWGWLAWGRPRASSSAGETAGFGLPCLLAAWLCYVQVCLLEEVILSLSLSWETGLIWQAL